MKLGDLAREIGLELADATCAEFEITGLGSLEAAGPGDLAYVAERRLAAALATTRAGAVICPADLAATAPCPALVSRAPAADFGRASRLVASRARIVPGVHPTAVVAETARLGADVRIGPYAVVGDRTVLGNRVEIHAHVTVYQDVTIGAETLVYAGCVLREGTIVGERCILQPAVVLGSDGFGFGRRADGGYEKIEQTGVVRIEDDVEIGAGSAVDRATFGETVVGRGTKIDNLVQIGHNSTVGPDTILCAQVGLAGSTTLGKSVTLAGQVGVAGHLEIGDGAIATAQTGIPSSVAAGALVSGYPAIDNRLWLKSSAIFTRLPDMHKSLRKLEARVMELEARLGATRKDE
jgi:UDP-3-O-[3-hydroxymyristoyl] glucosamine N-acyltransferase